MIMFLGHFLKEPTLILVRNGNWLLLVLSTFICECILYLVLEACLCDFGVYMFHIC